MKYKMQLLALLVGFLAIPMGLNSSNSNCDPKGNIPCSVPTWVSAPTLGLGSDAEDSDASWGSINFNKPDITNTPSYGSKKDPFGFQDQDVSFSAY